MTETLQLGGLIFEVRRSDRRKTLGLTVDRGGELVAHVPAATSVEELTPLDQQKAALGTSKARAQGRSRA